MTEEQRLVDGPPKVKDAVAFGACSRRGVATDDHERRSGVVISRDGLQIPVEGKGGVRDEDVVRA